MKLILLYWDQLTLDISSLEQYDENSKVILIESLSECTRVKHHKKKLVFLISAMRHFKQELTKNKIKHSYYVLDDNCHDISSALVNELKHTDYQQLIITHPSEYHQLQEIRKFSKTHKLDLAILPDKRFIATLKEFSDFAKGKKQLVMESFYREMRKKTGLLMDANKPIGGQWNLDKLNRNALEVDHKIPNIPGFKPDKITKQVIKLVEERFSDHFGDIDPFWYAVSKKQANQAFQKFIKVALPNFGEYQDAMHYGEDFVYHSVIAQYLHMGLLDPLQVCSEVESEYHQGNISLACAEGFIRQVIGWREFIRGVYWHYMPKYLKLNHLDYANALPELYWHGKTKMRCLQHCISSTRKHAYSHHIQRLMITGNFAALIGVKPELIHEWYLIVYIDAFEWVELPNTVGMATYSDGGIVGTKPYISSSNYIKKMSNFCDNCHYKSVMKTGDKACPFNYLYWNYLYQHREKLKGNHRLRMPYASLAKFSNQRIKQITTDSKNFFQLLYADKV